MRKSVTTQPFIDRLHGTRRRAEHALVGTEAANLTGNALGPVVEIRLRELATFVLAAPPRGQTKALHVQSFLISPTRPGRALRELHLLGIPPIA